MNLNEDLPLPITCPECGERFGRTIRELKEEPEFACPGCATGFYADKLLSNLKRTEDDGGG